MIIPSLQMKCCVLSKLSWKHICILNLKPVRVRSGARLNGTWFNKPWLQLSLIQSHSMGLSIAQILFMNSWISWRISIMNYDQGQQLLSYSSASFHFEDNQLYLSNYESPLHQALFAWLVTVAYLPTQVRYLISPLVCVAMEAEVSPSFLPDAHQDCDIVSLSRV